MGPSHFSKKKYSLSCFKQACKYLIQYSFLMPHSTAFFTAYRTGCTEHLLVRTHTRRQCLCPTWTVPVALLPAFPWADPTLRLTHICICCNNVAAMRSKTCRAPAALESKASPCQTSPCAPSKLQKQTLPLIRPWPLRFTC